MEDRKIGFIGLGIMGKPMADNLVKAGYHLHILSSRENVRRYFSQKGAVLLSTPKEMARVCDVIITMLPDSPQVKEVALGDQGIIQGLKEDGLLIDMSTIDVDTTREINERFRFRKADSLDAPVSGGQQGAVDASLSIMVGGSREAFSRAHPVLRALGKNIVHMGEAGAGQVAKSCNQIATALATQGVVEAFSLAKRAGMDLTLVRKALLGGFAQSRALEIAGQRMVDGNFTPGFKMKLYNKDLRIACRAADSHSLKLPGTALVFKEMETLADTGNGELDFSALIKILA